MSSRLKFLTALSRLRFHRQLLESQQRSIQINFINNEASHFRMNMCSQWRTLASASSSDSGSRSGDGNGMSGGNDKSTEGGETEKGKESGKLVVEEGKEGKEEDEDSFGVDDFLSADSDEEEEAARELERKLKELEDAKHDDAITPEITKELMERMVTHLTRTEQGDGDGTDEMRVGIIPFISPLTIDVLRAVRICTNSIVAAGSHTSPNAYPICRRVVAYLDIQSLNLTPSAEVALKILAGRQRLHMVNRRLQVKVSCDKFPSAEENRTYIVSRLHALVKQAKLAVGQNVDETPLHHWDEVVAQVERQASEEVEEAGSVDNLLGTKPSQIQQTQ